MGLEDVYDEPTLWAIDRDRPHGATRAVGGWRGAIVAGALNAGIGGMREAFEVPMPKPQVVEVSPDPTPRPDARVRLLFVPHAPRATRAFVRW